VVKQKLDLFEFAAATMAEPVASTTKIVGRHVSYAGLTGTPLHRKPDYVGCHASFEDLLEAFHLSASQLAQRLT
jgi:hypothetical protein